MAADNPEASRTKMLVMRVKRMEKQHIHQALYCESAPVTSITAWKVGGEPVPFERMLEEEKQGHFAPMKVGDPWGAAWDTWWLHVKGTVPPSWASRKSTTPELVVDLGQHQGPGFSAEGLVYRPDGTVVKAVEPYNNSVPLPGCGKPFDFYIEAAANPEIPNGFPYYPTDLGDTGVKKGPELYRLTRLEVGLLDKPVWKLSRQVRVLLGLAEQLPADRARRAQILAALQDAMDELDTNNISGTATAASRQLERVLAQHSEGSFTVWAAGYAHIDTPWLWPERETPRKVARTFSNQLQLMDADPSYVFVATSAQHYAWLKAQHPDLFGRVKKKVAARQMIPIGGMWVESDANLPSGESMARQFLLGTTWFKREFGYCAPVAFLPDSFGYSGNLPQIARLAGNKWFVTQKISWNDTNRFPHSTFWWQGIDGTAIWTHFPPSNKYNSDMSPADVAASEKNNTEKARSSSSLLLFGWGDGGGGATREMLEDAHLQADLLGSPRVKLGNPADFFAANEKEFLANGRLNRRNRANAFATGSNTTQETGSTAQPDDPSIPVWNGELYLEQHRGTTSSEAATKRGNRTCESLLRVAEWWATQACVQEGLAYPYDELNAIWERVCLYQFHDTLPGSSIAWVYEEVEREQKRLEARIRAIIDRSIRALAGKGSTQLEANAGPYPQLGIAAGSISPESAQSRETASSVHLQATGASSHPGGQRFVFDCPAARYVLDGEGHLLSAYDRRSGRDAIDPASPANVLQLFRDAPSEFDAWNIDENYELTPEPGAIVSSATASTSTRTVTITGHIGHSAFTQKIGIDPDTQALRLEMHVDWHESDRLLKLAFPLALSAQEETAEIQYGHIHRPIIRNTSWDEARYEYAMQRWMRVAEGTGRNEFGVGIANHAIYGHDVKPFTRTNGQIGTRVRLTLLRASHFPVPHADQGPHDFTVLFAPGASLAHTVRLGYRAAVPALPVKGGHAVTPLLSVTPLPSTSTTAAATSGKEQDRNQALSGILPEALKMAQDCSGDVIVRLYEALGVQEKAQISTAFDWDDVREVGLIEQPNEAVRPVIMGKRPLEIGLHPFQIVTLRFSRHQTDHR